MWRTVSGIALAVVTAGGADNEKDNDHAFSQLSALKALTCRARVRGPWPSLVSQGNSVNAKKNYQSRCFRSDLLPLETKWSCIGAGKEMCFTQDECVMRNTGCCFVEQVCGCFGVAEVQRSIN